MTLDLCGFHSDGKHRLFVIVGEWTPGIDCECPLKFVCSCSLSFFGRCESASREKCVPCSERYRRRVARIFMSGFTAKDGA